LNHALEVVELFSTCSGLRASFDKTQAVWIGARRGCGEELQTSAKVLMTVTFPINDIFLKKQSPSNLCICSIF
jgi:hypothetical protein